MAPRLLVGGLVAGLVAVFFVLWHGKTQKDALAYESAVTNGLINFYSELTKPTTNQTPLTPDAIVLALLSNQSRHSFSLSGVSNPTNILVAIEATQFGRTNLICVVRAGDRTFYGLCADGTCRRVTHSESQSWPHAALSENERFR